jgi:predicted anti-sigma-YlaC factor YlaD
MESHSDCHKICALLSDYIDQDLTQEVCREIEQHLLTCVRCRAMVDTLVRTIQLYQDEQCACSLSTEQTKKLWEALSLEEFYQEP